MSTWIRRPHGASLRGTKRSGKLNTIFIPPNLFVFSIPKCVFENQTFFDWLLYNLCTMCHLSYKHFYNSKRRHLVYLYVSNYKFCLVLELHLNIIAWVHLKCCKTAYALSNKTKKCLTYIFFVRRRNMIGYKHAVLC